MEDNTKVINVILEKGVNEFIQKLIKKNPDTGTTIAADNPAAITGVNTGDTNTAAAKPADNPDDNKVINVILEKGMNEFIQNLIKKDTTSKPALTEEQIEKAKEEDEFAKAKEVETAKTSDFANAAEKAKNEADITLAAAKKATQEAELEASRLKKANETNIKMWNEEKEKLTPKVESKVSPETSARVTVKTMIINSPSDPTHTSKNVFVYYIDYDNRFSKFMEDVDDLLASLKLASVSKEIPKTHSQFNSLEYDTSKKLDEVVTMLGYEKVPELKV